MSENGTSSEPWLGLSEAVSAMLPEESWAAFARDGFLPLGPVCLPDEAVALSRRAGTLGLSRPLDLTAPAVRPFFELMHHPLMHEVCARVYGPRAPVMIFRADMGTAEAGPLGRWRQNAAEVQALDRDELVTVVVGLAGAPGHARVDAIAGSHRLGLLEDVEGRRAPDALSRRRPDDRAVGLEIEPGHALLLHRWLVHRPAASSGPVPSMVAYWFVDGRARSTITGYPELPALVGEVERAPYPCVGVLERQCAALREAADRAEEYARSLERECTRLRGELARRAS